MYMDRQAFVVTLESLIGDLLKNLSVELVEITCRHEGKNLMIMLLVDRPESGIRLDECAKLNRQLGDLLDEKNLIQERYVLEVSSPGLDRPLKTKNDFWRCSEKSVRFFLKVPLNGKWEIVGTINRVEDEAVYVQAGAELLALPFSSITMAKQVIA